MRLYLLNMHKSACVELTCAEYTLGILRLEGNHRSECVIKIVFQIPQNRRELSIFGCGRFPKLRAKPKQTGDDKSQEADQVEEAA